MWLSDNKLSNNKLSDDKLSDNNLTSEVVENRSFFMIKKRIAQRLSKIHVDWLLSYTN